MAYIHGQLILLLANDAQAMARVWRDGQKKQ